MSTSTKRFGMLIDLSLCKMCIRDRAAGDGKNQGDAYLDGVAVPPQVGGAPAMPAATAPAAPEPAPSPAAPEAPTPTAADNAEQALYAAIAEDYGLTRREAEVLPFLARGRSAKVIAEALFVSESTVRKMCIRDRFSALHATVHESHPTHFARSMTMPQCGREESSMRHLLS